MHDRTRRPDASTPYQRRPRDFFIISENGWREPGQIGSLFTKLP